ncbi:MAG: hypothetical protein HW387_769 [Parachlamydiales bacterium]|nr:hypothetical protein [Parachlamydiales bacterium]
MKRITAELSLYPLTENHILLIKEFITRLNTYKELEINTNSISTQIVGEHSRVFDIISKETAAIFSSGNPCVVVLKLLSLELDVRKIY